MIAATATTAGTGAGRGLSRLVLDVDAWARLVDLAAVTVPADFATSRRELGEVPSGGGGSPGDGVGDGLGEGVSAEAGAQALQRLRASGLVDGAGQVHPGMVAAMSLLGGAPVRVRVRSWAGDRVVLGALALGPDGGAGLARLRRVPPLQPGLWAAAAGQVPGTQGPDPEAQDAVGVELSVFPPGLALAGLRRLLPGLPTGPVDGSGVHLPWTELLSLTQALTAVRRRTDAGGSTGGQGTVGDVDAAVARLLAGDCGEDGLPSWLGELSVGLESVVEVTVVAVRGPGRPGGGDGQVLESSSRAWFGMWVGSGGHLVRLGAHGGPVTASPGLGGTAGEDPGALIAEAVVDLAPVDEPGLLRDVTSALAEALAWSTAIPVDGGLLSGDSRTRPEGDDD